MSTIINKTDSNGYLQSDTMSLGGNTIDTNSGTKSAGTQRVVIATDQPQLTNALKVDGSAVTQPVSGTVTANAGTGTFNIQTNASVNIAQVNGATTSTAASGVQKVGIVGNAGSSVDASVGAGTAPSNAVVTGGIFNSTSPAPSNGQSMAFQFDQAGNTKTFPGIALTTLSAWNSSTSLNATQTIYTNSGAPAVLIQLDQTSTITAGAITFEATYDGTNWVTVPANSVLDPTSTSYAQISLPYTLVASTNKPFIISSNGWQGLRIKLSTQITGSGTVTPYYALLAYDPITSVVAYSPTATNFNVAVGSSLPAGSNTIGAVTQASGPWTSNITQIAGNAVATAASGIAKVGLTDASGNAINSTSNALNTSITNASLAVTESGTWTVQPGNTANTTPWLTTNVPASAGATGWQSKQMGDGTVGSNWNGTKQQVVGSAGTFGGYVMLYNPNTAVSYIQVFNKTSANVTLGTTTPDYVIPLPGIASASATGSAANNEIVNGVKFSTGLTMAVTTTPTGSTAPANNCYAWILYN